MNTDPIADYLTRIRNACIAGNKIVKIPISKSKKEISKILYNQGYILSYKIESLIDKKKNKLKFIKIAIKYEKNNKNISVIKCIKRISKPGLRKYCNYKKLPRVLNGLGIAIISTSQGIMTDKDAKAKKIGGEILCYVY